MVKQILHSLLLQKKIFFSAKNNIIAMTAIASICFSVIAEAEVTASIDKTSLDVGDNLQLTIYAGNISNNAVPDLSNVVNDFDLIGSSQTQQVAMIDHRMTSETVWIFTLSPTHTGTITIAPISVGTQQTQPITVQVGDGTNDNSSANNASTPASSPSNTVQNTVAPPVVTPTPKVSNVSDVFLKAELSPDAPYVQSQAIYTLRLFYDKQIANPQISEPTVSGGDFIRIGQNDVYQKIINGHPYQVIEMKYALFPEKSGPLTIKGPTFQGNMFTGSMVTFSNSNFKPVQAAANTIHATVKPIPTSAANGWWLPANDVQLSDQWSTDLANVQVGVPITRTVKLAAQGIMATQLPVLISSNIPGFQVYPDKPALTSSSDGENVFGVRIEKAAYIPTQAGSVTLPAIVVNWWNTQTDKMETATIPAKTINILPAANGASPPVTPVAITPTNNTLTTSLTTTKSLPIVHAKTASFWFWVAIGLGTLWLLTVILWLIYRSLNKPKAKSVTLLDNDDKTVVSDSLKQAKAKIEQAVKAHDPQQFSLALITLAQKVWPETAILSLTDIANKCKSVAAKEAIAALDKIRYSNKSGTWQAESAWQIIKSEITPEKTMAKRDEGQLPKLYPE